MKTIIAFSVLTILALTGIAFAAEQTTSTFYLDDVSSDNLVSKYYDQDDNVVCYVANGNFNISGYAHSDGTVSTISCLQLK